MFLTFLFDHSLFLPQAYGAYGLNTTQEMICKEYPNENWQRDLALKYKIQCLCGIHIFLYIYEKII